MCLAGSISTSQAQIEKCRELLQQGNAVAALVELHNVISLSPKSAEAWALMGQAYVRVGRADSAATAGRTAIKLNDELPDGYVAVSQAAVLEKNFAEAYKIIYKGLKARKFNPVLLAQLGDVHVAADSLDNAVIAYSQALDGEPNNLALIEKVGDTYMKQKSGATMAAIQYEKIVAIDSSRADVILQAFAGFMKDRQYKPAADALIKVAERDPSNTKAMMEVATLYYKSKMWASAARWYGRYFEKASDAPEARMNFMETLFLTRQYKEALAQAELVIVNAPDSKMAVRVIAQSAFETGNYTKSVEYYGKMQAVDTIAIQDLKRVARAYLELKTDSLAIARSRRSFDAILQPPISPAFLRRSISRRSSMKRHPTSIPRCWNATRTTKTPSSNL